MLARLDTAEDYGGERCVGVGFLKEHVVVVVFAERDNDTIRLIPFAEGIEA